MDQFESIPLERDGTKKLRRDAVPSIFCYDQRTRTGGVGRKLLATSYPPRMTKSSSLFVAGCRGRTAHPRGKLPVVTAVPSVGVPGQTEHSAQNKSHTAISSVPSRNVQVRTDLQGSFCVGTAMASKGVRRDKRVQTLVRVKSIDVQVNTMLKETCGKATQVNIWDVEPTSTRVKYWHPEAHLPSPDVLRVRGKDNASDATYEPSDSTVTSDNTVGNGKCCRSLDKKILPTQGSGSYQCNGGALPGGDSSRRSVAAHERASRRHV